MIWLAILLVAVAVLEWLKKERAIGFALMLASLGFVVSLGVLNVEAFIVRQNIQREIKGYDDVPLRLDSQYFLNLSDDAVPALVAGFQNNSLTDSVREELGAALACKRYEHESDLEHPRRGGVFLFAVLFRLSEKHSYLLVA